MLDGETCIVQLVGGGVSSNGAASDRLLRLVLALSVGCFTLQQCFVVPVIARLQVEYDTSQTTATWVLTAYLLSAAVATPLLGRAGDTFGRKRILLVALVLLAIGSFGAAVAPTIGWLLAARVVQGASGAMLPLAFAVLRDVSRPERLSSGVRLMTSVTAVGFGVGLVVAGPIVELLGVRWLFWLPMICTCAAALLALVVVPQSSAARAATPSVLPGVALGGWLCGILLAVSHGSTWGWTSPLVLTLIGGAVVLFVGWLWLERTAATPLIDLDMMRLRGVWTTNLIVLLTGFSMFALFGFLPQLLQTPTSTGYGLGATVTESGRYLIPWSVTSFLSGMLASRVIRATSVRVATGVATLLMATAMVLLALFHTVPWVVFFAMALHGTGSGTVLAATALVVVHVVPAWQVGVASGMNANIRVVGGAVGATLMGVIVTGHTTTSGYPAERGYTLGFVMLAGVFVLSHLATYAIPRAGFGTVRADPSASAVPVASVRSALVEP
jgi:predicted MFS family arabinose efflux permease